MAGKFALSSIAWWFFTKVPSGFRTVNLSSTLLSAKTCKVNSITSLYRKRLHKGRNENKVKGKSGVYNSKRLIDSNMKDKGM